MPSPSPETTSSVVKPSNPVPSAEIGAAQAQVPAPAVTESSVATEAPAPLLELAQAPRPAAKPAVMAAPPPQRSARTAGVARSQIYSRSFRDAKPVNFGARSPKPLPVHGVDVSRWQGEIEWGRLRMQGANFAYIKATDGGDHLDPMFKKNWHAADKAGLKRGAYHFFYWCRTAAEQADWFIRNVPKVKGALPPVIDVEYNHLSNCKRRLKREQILEKMQVFMDRLEAHYGQRPIIYTPPDFYRDNLRDAFPNHPFWLRSVAAHPEKVYPGRKWVFWQYSGSGLSQGVKGRIDLNAFHGTEDEWHEWVEKHAG